MFNPIASIDVRSFVCGFDSSGTFKLEGDRWPTVTGNWRAKVSVIELSPSSDRKVCKGPGRYRVRLDGNRVSFDSSRMSARPEE